MTKFRKLALAGVLAAAVIGPASPASADKSDRCDGAVERLEDRFREIEAKRGYDAAVKWWDGAWRRYHDRCVV